MRPGPAAGRCLLLFGFLVLADGSVPMADPVPRTQDAEIEEPDEVPRELGLSEKARSELVQIDVSLEGSPEAIAALRLENFRVKINRKRIDSFLMDLTCPAIDDPAGGDAPRTATVDRRGRPIAPPPQPLPAHYLIYLDQSQLTLTGRAETMRTLGELIPDLVDNDGMAMIVSNAARLKIIHRFSDDAASLLESVDQMEGDFEQLDLAPERELQRVNDIVDEMNEQFSGSVSTAIGIARRYMREEQIRTERSFRRLALSMALLNEVSPPKAVIYFGDTLRSNAGEHYLKFFGPSVLESTSTDDTTGTLSSGLAFDAVVNAATAQGVRFFTVKSDGLSFSLDNLPNSLALSRSRGNPDTSRSRQTDAQNTLANLAVETGGRAFPFGGKASAIFEAVGEDLSCLAVISVDPEGFRTDAPLPIKITLKNSDAKIRSRGRVVFQSDSSRETSRLLGAFAAPELTGGGFGVQAHLVPTGFQDGRFHGLLQIAVPATPLTTANWELGASILDADRVHQEISTQVKLDRPGVPVVFERELTLDPGRYEVVFVARETNSGVLESDRIEFEWPRLRRAASRVSPVSVLQPSRGLFLRGDDRRLGGSLARNPSFPLALDEPTALIGLVCVERGAPEGLRLERRLVGPAGADFDPIPIATREERCAQYRDVLPAGSLAPGSYRYTVTLVEDDRELERIEQTFQAGSPAGGTVPDGGAS